MSLLCCQAVHDPRVRGPLNKLDLLPALFASPLVVVHVLDVLGPEGMEEVRDGQVQLEGLKAAEADCASLVSLAQQAVVVRGIFGGPIAKVLEKKIISFKGLL